MTMILNSIELPARSLLQLIGSYPGKIQSVKGDAINPLEDLNDREPASIPSQIRDVSAGHPGRTSLSYQEELSFFHSDTTIEYQGEDGSRLFISYSYTAISRKVHYEMIQNAEDKTIKPEKHPHPLNDLFGAEATSGRILEFAQRLINKFRAMEGSEEYKVEKLIKKMEKGIEKGFKRALKDLREPSSKTRKMVEETFKRVMKGMNALRQGGGLPQINNEKRVTYDEEISYTTASLEIHLIA